jgi:hypothetical protein
VHVQIRLHSHAQARARTHTVQSTRTHAASRAHKRAQACTVSAYLCRHTGTRKHGACTTRDRIAIVASVILALSIGKQRHTVLARAYMSVST